jgi:DNA-directed RNA polymerase subunit beta'
MIQFTKEFDYIKIKLASPARILQWANRKLPNGQYVGEVQKSETINYRTFKPEMDGLFCERIFGPSKSFECACGKYKRVRYEGLICERCGVELTESRVRRHRMGYINLIYPVTHVWYINSRPNFMALLLEVEECEKQLNTSSVKSTTVNLWDERIKRIKLASLVYFIAEDEISFYGLHWDLQQYRKSRELGRSDYPLKPYPKPQNQRYNTPKYLLRATPNFLIGAPLIKKELERLDLKSEIFRTRYFILVCTKVLNKEKPLYDESKWSRKWEQQRIYKIRENAIKRIRILENLIGTRSSPAWMILTILPVIPPALRPMIQLEGGRFATSDLNELYRRIITRNNRLLRLLEIDAPQLIIRNEKRLLQEAVDTLIDNGKEAKLR